MINLFNTSRHLPEQQVLTAVEREQTTDELIEEIHSAFYSEGEALLAQANQVLATPLEKDVDRGERLNKLGFFQTPLAVKAGRIATDRTISENLKKKIEYYNQTYPLYRFINEAGVKRICEKYDLICGEVTKYIGSVPEENLVHIENFKGVKEEDNIYYTNTGWNINGRMIVPYQMYKSAQEQTIPDPVHGAANVAMDSFYYRKNETFSICAPMKDFDTEGMDIRDRKLIARPVPDPVVLFPVDGGYLIITAWGKEAKDGEITHAKNN